MKLELAPRFLSKIQLTSLLKKLKPLSLHNCWPPHNQSVISP